ncbi:MAG: DNA/RNA non-specific endonuclease [Bacteroidales bacterium]|nr:DNA/RNA non-specific endonuclease [Bacteroidales bacterium]
MNRIIFSTAVVLLCLQACTKPEDNGGGALSLGIPRLRVSNIADAQFITVTADEAWTLDIDWGGAGPWGELSVSSGMRSKKGITFSWTKNAGSGERSAVFTLNGKTRTVSQTFVQEGTPSTPVQPDIPTTLQPDIPGGWLELPALDRSDCCFFTHSMTQGTYKGRNYSFYLDPKARIALWVAYPLNKALIGNGSRSEEWALDPKVPEQYQSVVYGGYKSGGYDRGHQLPSADRLGDGINETTFYGTNITPQLSHFNQRIWASLEGMVRSWSSQFDTLYVVTGTDVAGATLTAYDNYYKEITVPTGYYKVLLGYKRNGTVGITNTTGGYTGIAFYFEHRNDYPNSKETIFQQSMTIGAIENKLGMDFFVNLPAVAGPPFAAKAESTFDPWWKN